MSTQQPELEWRQILSSAGPYPLEAFQFVRDGLSYTVASLHPDEPEEPTAELGASRHVSGQQLCMGLRDYAISQFGLLAPTVLEHWHIRRSDDFGRIVFAMIEHGLMSKTEEDTLDDFRGVYDFDEAFSPEALAARIGTR
ncbi:MAG: hypothetical protein KDA22_15150 [Phycisphaerales bacterium]|nr:hypothetical protein [Phycisphaerales bacterium]